MVKRQTIYPIGPSIAYIPLTRKQFAVVDVEDAKWLSRWNWCVAEAGRGVEGFYAYRQYTKDGKKVGVYMHLEIVKRTKSKPHVEHRNNEKLHDFKGNLRRCTVAEYHANRKKPRHNTSGFKGVDKLASGKFKARVRYKGKLQYGDLRMAIEEAVADYARMSAELYGEFART